MDDPRTCLRALRRSRSSPAAKAARQGPRRDIYGAALQQFEELLEAAETVGPASRPLPLYYALSQGGRALVAAHGDVDAVRGHGIGQHGQTGQDPLRFEVETRPTRDGADAFGAVCRALGTTPWPNPVAVGALWTALPGTYQIPDACWHPAWRRSFIVDDRSTSDAGKMRVLGIGGNPNVSGAAALEDLARRYPPLPSSTRGGLVSGSEQLPAGSFMADLEWDGADGTVEDHTYKHKDQQWLLPSVQPAGPTADVFVTWWTLLFALSLLARYEPGTWMQALDVRTSSLAVPLEAIMEQALEAVPVLLYRSIIEHPSQM